MKRNLPSAAIPAVALILALAASPAIAQQQQPAQPGLAAPGTQATPMEAADQPRVHRPQIGADLAPAPGEEEPIGVDRLERMPVAIGDVEVGAVEGVARDAAGDVGFVVDLAPELGERRVFISATRMFAREASLLPGYNFEELMALPELTEPVLETLERIPPQDAVAMRVAELPEPGDEVTFDPEPGVSPPGVGAPGADAPARATQPRQRD